MSYCHHAFYNYVLKTPRDMKSGNELSELISALERIMTDVKQSCDESPQSLDNLESTIATTARLIDGAGVIPSQERQTWLSDLAELSTSTPPKTRSSESASVSAPEHDEFLSCNCPLDDPQFRDKSASLPTKRHVRCMHGCNVVFCSATCRKKHARTHHTVCDALRQKKILSTIGLIPDEEMF